MNDLTVFLDNLMSFLIAGCQLEATECSESQQKQGEKQETRKNTYRREVTYPKGHVRKESMGK